MNEILGSARTWFLESFEQGPYGDLAIRMVEGMKGATPQPVQVGDQTLGPYFPVTVEPNSRCVTVRFKDPRAIFTFPESYDSASLGVKMTEGGFVRAVDGSEFSQFVSKTTTAIEAYRSEFTEWLIWTEDQLFQVVASEPPEIVLETDPPDLSIARGQTWSAS